MDVACHNFGIQEWAFRTELEREMFPGTPELREGYAYPSTGPGLGIGFDEELADRYPCDDSPTDWTEARLADGSISRP
jgi:mannonate dehydratase